MMRNCTSPILIFTLFFLGVPALNLAWAQGQEVRVFDGDTFSVSGEVIRLWGIDAPEHKQPCWRGSVEYACRCGSPFVSAVFGRSCDTHL